jgi:hypothetical protein
LALRMTFRLGELLTGGLARIIIPVANLLLSLAFLFVIPAGVKQMMRHSERPHLGAKNPCILFACARSHHFFRAIAEKSGAPQVPMASKAPKRITASMLSRPCLVQ